jgi:hypothetical protein
MARLSNTEHIWRYYGESYDLPGERLPTPDKSDYRTSGFGSIFPCPVTAVGSTGRCNTIWSVGPTITSPGKRTCLALLAETQARIAFWVILTWWALLALVFNAMRVRAECCVDPLTPPGLPDKCPRENLSDTERINNRS